MSLSKFLIKKLTVNKDNGNFSLSELPMNYSFNGIDLIKFICSILVCIIHIAPFKNVSFLYADFMNFELQHYICRLAVPFYFVTSGFLLFRKIDLYNIEKKRIQNYCFKILRLLGTWTLLLIIGPTKHLWYLGALVVAVAFFSFLLKYNVKPKYIVIISTIFYIIGLLGDSYYGIIEPLKKVKIFNYLISGYKYVFSTTRNGIFMGLIFVIMGAFIAHKKIVINLKTAFIGFILSMILLYVEVSLLQYFSVPKDHNMYICLIPSTFFLFYIASHMKLKKRKIYGKLRVMGMMIYYLHLLVYKIILISFYIIKKYYNYNLFSLSFVSTLIAVILLAYLIEKLSHKNKFKWLKFLYS